MARKTPLSPGQKVKISGQYELTGPRGGRQGREATLTKHEPAPPTPRPKMTWKLTDTTKHKGN